MTSRVHEPELEADEEELRFFSQPPPRYDDAGEAPSPSSLSPTSQLVLGEPRSKEALAEAARFGARRSKLQRRVAVTLCAAASLLMLGLVTHGRAEAERRLADATPTAAAVPEPMRVPVAAAATVPTEPSVEPAPDAEPAPSPAPPLESSAPTDVAQLLRRARNLLNSGRSREGVATAREALAQAPQDAEPYMLLGAGLQDLGKYAEARATFEACLEHATRGPVASCHYFARR